jgi:hypothetical protein
VGVGVDSDVKAGAAWWCLHVCVGVGVQVEVEAETGVKRKRTGVVGGEGVGVEAWVSGWTAM